MIPASGYSKKAFKPSLPQALSKTMRSSVIDIGSNSIKLLVAQGKSATPIFEKLSETRLSPPAESVREYISAEAFSAGLEAVFELTREARKFSPQREIIVGTSLFRTAANAKDFARAVEKMTGTPMLILSGEEEAELISDGVATDPSVQMPCAIFDLGGGSLEIIIKSGTEKQRSFRTSLKLGAVRMTRRFFKFPEQAIPDSELLALRKAVREETAAILPEKLPRGAQAVFCGGAASICSWLVPEKSTAALEDFLKEICRKTLSERIELGVPEKRADIFPAAIAVLAELCSVGEIISFSHSHRNLRYGLCARLNTEKL